MPSKKRQELYDKFITGNKPTQDDFTDLIDSMINIADDGIGASKAGEPMEIVEQGINQRLLDFSSSKDNPIWRVSAKATNGVNGLNLATVDNESKLFIKKDNGLIGINNEDPKAKLHIAPGSEMALQVDNRSSQASVLIDADGSIGIGTPIQTDYRVSIDGKVNFKGEVTSDKLIKAENGINVNGDKLIAQQGLSVRNGITVETGPLTANDGLVVNGKALNANRGAVVSGSALKAQNGLIVTEGAVVETGELTINDGLKVDGGELVVNDGLVINSATTVNDGITINTGVLTAKDGLSVSDSLFSANNRVILGNQEDGEVTVNGLLEANQGLVVSGSRLEVEQGLNVLNGETVINDSLTVNGSVSIQQASFSADGPVTLGDANNSVTIDGRLDAKKGMVVSGAEIKAENGLMVNAGNVTVNSLLNANNGLSVNNSSLSANGQVTLGNIDNGSVTIQGGLNATNGAVISGSQLLVQHGMKVNSTFEAPYESKLGNVVIQNLNVSEIEIAGSLGLESINLESVNAGNAQMGTVTMTGPLNIYGKASVNNDIRLAAGKLIATYEGPDAIKPVIKVQKGIVTGGNGHFDIQIDPDKLATITYDDASDIRNFLNDWDIYKNNNPEMAKGFNFERIGSGSWDIKDMEVQLDSSNVAFKEHRIAYNGVRIIYTGLQTDAAQFEFVAAENIDSDKFDFEINDLTLTIKYPGVEGNRTVGNLLNDWMEWKNNNESEARYFEIQQTGDDNWRLIDTSSDLTLTESIIRSYDSGGLTITNQSDAGNQPRVIISIATPSSGKEVLFSASPNALSIQLGGENNSPQAVYNAWNDWKKAGNDVYGFDIERTTNTTPISVFLEEQLVMIDAANSRIDTSSFSITYTGDNAEVARVKFQEGIGNDFVIEVNETDKILTINYPISPEERMISNLLNVWENVVEKFGFNIISLQQEFSLQQEESLEKLVANVYEYETATLGVDKILVSYFGLEGESPKLLITPNSGNSFDILIDSAKMMTIKYPADKSGTIDALFAYWEAFPNKDKFMITRNDIKDALVTDIKGTLLINPENDLFSKGIIRTDRVYIDGSLVFGGSDLEINTISDNKTLVESSDTILPTQKAVKTYVDNGLAIKADQAYVTGELAKKADRTELTEGLTLKADKTELTDRLALKADRTELTDGLALKADAVATLTALAGKAGMVKPSAFNLGIGEIITINDISLTETSCGILMVRITMGSTNKAGLFAVYGTDGIIKIAGDGMSDQRDNVDTCNIYSIAGAVTIQNASSNAVVALVTYFGE